MCIVRDQPIGSRTAVAPIPPKPKALPVAPDNIPEALRNHRQFVLWKYTWKTDTRKWDKPPLQFDGKPARANDPRTWTSYRQAVYWWQERGFDGIGYVPTEDDGLVFLDLDHVRNPDGTFRTWSPELRARFAGNVPEPAELIARLGSYAELSPSGAGIRIICRGSLPEGRRKIGGKSNRCPDGLEMYSAAHYLTLTGHKLPDAPTTVVDCTVALAELHRAVFGSAEPNSPADGTAQIGAIPVTSLDDLAVIERASHSKGGEKFLRLWNGDAGDYASRSEADFALAGTLAFWTGGNREQIERLLRQSGLVRPKWDHRHYLERTIRKVLERQRAFYNPLALQQGCGKVAADSSCPDCALQCEGEVRSNRDKATLLQVCYKASAEHRTNPWDCPYCFGVAGELRASPALIPAPCGKRSCPVCGPHWRQVTLERFGTHILRHEGKLFVDCVADCEWQATSKAMRRDAKARGVPLRFVAIRDAEFNMTVIASVPPTAYAREVDQTEALKVLERGVEQASVEPRAYSACRPWGKIEPEAEAEETAVRVPGGASKEAFSATVRAWGAEAVQDRGSVVKCSVRRAVPG